jgi:hypothetical protein
MTSTWAFAMSKQREKGQVVPDVEREPKHVVASTRMAIRGRKPAAAGPGAPAQIAGSTSTGIIARGERQAPPIEGATRRSLRETQSAGAGGRERRNVADHCHDRSPSSFPGTPEPAGVRQPTDFISMPRAPPSRRGSSNTLSAGNTPMIKTQSRFRLCGLTKIKCVLHRKL